MPKELEELKSQLEQHLEFYALERSQDRKKIGRDTRSKQG